MKIAITLVFVLLSFLSIGQEKFLKIKGEVVDRFTNKERVKNVDIIVVNDKKDTLVQEQNKNGKFSIWVPVGEVMEVFFYTADYYPKYFIVNTKGVPEYYRSETYGINAEISLTPFEEEIADATPFDEPMGYVNFSSGKQVFYWDESYTNEIRKYMNVAYLEQARLITDQWINHEKLYTVPDKKSKLFVVPSASTFVLRYVFEEQNFNLAMDHKNLRKGKLVKEFGILLGGMIDVDRSYLYQFSDKDKINKANDLVYQVTETNKNTSKDLFIVPKEPEVYLAENLFFKLGQWMELVHISLQAKPDLDALNWNLMAQIINADNLEVASYLSDSILSFIADVKAYREQCIAFEKHVKEHGEEVFKKQSGAWETLKSNFKKLYGRV